jgi:hypothetical protein
MSRRAKVDYRGAIRTGLDRAAEREREGRQIRRELEHWQDGIEIEAEAYLEIDREIEASAEPITFSLVVDATVSSGDFVDLPILSLDRTDRFPVEVSWGNPDDRGASFIAKPASLEQLQAVLLQVASDPYTGQVVGLSKAWLEKLAPLKPEPKPVDEKPAPKAKREPLDVNIDMFFRVPIAPDVEARPASPASPLGTITGELQKSLAELARDAERADGVIPFPGSFKEGEVSRGSSVWTPAEIARIRRGCKVRRCGSEETLDVLAVPFADEANDDSETLFVPVRDQQLVVRYIALVNLDPATLWCGQKDGGDDNGPTAA